MVTYKQMGFTEKDMELVNKIGDWNFKRLANKVKDYYIKRMIVA